MGDVWFTADTHFGHANIIKHCNRPFKTVGDMDQQLIDKWNNVVAKNDTVYHLGDFALTKSESAIEQYFKQLNGTIHLTLGNHDKKVRKLKQLFASVHVYRELRQFEPNIILCHYAMRVWNKRHHGTWHLYGHSHGTLVDQFGKSMDVGVDTHPEYRPYHFDEIKQFMDQQVIFP